MAQSDSIGKLALALSKVQGVLKGAKKESENPFFKSKYADLESVWEAIRQPLADNELSVCQEMDYLVTENGTTTLLTTTLQHSSGEWRSGTMPLFLKDLTAQAQGSAISYARRYCLSAMIGVHQTDDDAQEATNRQQEAAEKKSQYTNHTIIPPSSAKIADTPETQEGTSAHAPAPSQTLSAGETNRLITVERWEELKIMGLDSGWPEAYMKLQIDREKKSGKTNAQVYAWAVQKFSVQNPNAVKEDKELEEMPF